MGNDLSQTLKSGVILIIETGEYSDYGFGGPVRMLKDVTKQRLAEEFRAQWKPAGGWDLSPSPGDFLPWLIAAGYAEDVDNVEAWHVGSYGDFDP